MPLPTIPDCYRTAWNWTRDGDTRTATNVMHFLAPTGDESDLFDAIDASVSGDMWDVTSNSIQVASITITKLDGVADSFIFNTDGTTKWDGSGGGSMIPQACALVKLTTGAGGRRGRGRVYLPWLADGNQIDGVLNIVNKGTAQTAWIAFANAMATAGKPLVVASYVGLATNQVQAITVEPIIATQRRRLTR